MSVSSAGFHTPNKNQSKSINLKLLNVGSWEQLSEARRTKLGRTQSEVKLPNSYKCEKFGIQTNTPNFKWTKAIRLPQSEDKNPIGPGVYHKPIKWLIQQNSFKFRKVDRKTFCDEAM